MASAAGGEVEVDVAEWFQAVAEEAITRATFGRSYDSGRVVFRMQARLMAFASEAFRKVLVPGYRYVGVASNRNREVTRRLYLNLFAPGLESIRRFLPTKKNRLSWSLDREIRRGLVALIGRRSAEAEEEDEDEAGLSDKGSGGFRDLSLTAKK